MYMLLVEDEEWVLCIYWFNFKYELNGIYKVLNCILTDAGMYS